MRMREELLSLLIKISPQGIAEQRGIAERMAASYPSLFEGDDVFVEAYSSIFPRCILTMAAFNQRRKTLYNGLKNSGEFEEEIIREAIEQLGKGANVRGEALTLEEFARLSNHIKNRQKG